MADKKISELAAVTEVASTNEYAVNESAVSKKASASQVVDFIFKRINGNSGAAGAYKTTQNLTANSGTFSSAGLTTVMTTTGVGTGVWKFKYTVIYQTGLSGTGIGLAVNHTGTATSRQNIIWGITTATGTANGVVDNDVAGTQMMEGKAEAVLNATIGSTFAGVATANANTINILEGVIDVTATGSLELKATTSSATTGFLVEDSTLELCKIE